MEPVAGDFFNSIGQQRTCRAEIAMSALPPKADIRPRDQDVCFGPIDGVIGRPASDVDTVVVDSLKALDPDRPIREADIER